MFEWSFIRKEMIENASNVFLELNLSVSEQEVAKCVDIFYNIMAYETKYVLLNGFQRQIEDAMTKTLQSEIGQVNPLRTLSDLMDSYLKKILAIFGTNPYNDYSGLTFCPLVKKLGKPEFTGIERYKSEGLTWKLGSPEKYILYLAIVPRNDSTHNAPKWDRATVLTYVKNCLAAYVLLTYSVRTELRQACPSIESDIKFQAQAENADIAAYDFIKFSKASGELKKNVIRCFILRLLANIGPMSETEIKKRVDDFVGTTTHNAGVYGLIGLEKKGKIVLIDKENKTYALTDAEKENLVGYAQDCSVNKSEFIKSLATLFSGSALEGCETEVFERFKSYVVQRFSAVSNIVDNVEEEDINVPNNQFVEFLNSILCDEYKSREVGREIINICRSNDIVYRLAAGAYISKLASDSKHDGLSILPRDVYLDTQVVLPMLCVMYKDFEPGDNLFFKIAKSILNIVVKNRGLRLKFCRAYMPEITNHVEKALYLTDIVDNPLISGRLKSRNVFFNHYAELKEADKLPEGIKTFKDYLYTLFDIYSEDEADGYASFLKHTLPGVVESKLFQEINVETIDIPFYDPESRKNSESVFQDVLRKEGLDKSSGTLTRDVVVGQFLFDQETIPRPFFITRDHSFVEYRALFAKRHKRGTSYFWQLFSPMSFVNSIDLMKMDIDTSMLSEELLLQFDNGTKEDAKFFADVISRLTELPSLSSAKKRERNRFHYELFIGKRYADITEEDLSNADLMADSISRVWDIATQHLQEKYPNDRTKQLKIFMDENLYKKFIKTIKQYSESKTDNKRELTESIDILLTEPETGLH